MLALHDVTKTAGRGKRQTTILDSVSFAIPRHTKLAVLGHPGSGKTTLLSIMAGTQIPTVGWVERRGIISPLSPLTRNASAFTTPRELIVRMAPFLHYDPAEVCRFVDAFAGLGAGMDVPLRQMPKKTVQGLNVALFYAVPCDYYLFDQHINLGPRHLKPQAWASFVKRRKQAGVILTTSLVNEARDLGGAGAVLDRGKVTLFDDVEDAIEAFSHIKPPPRPGSRLRVVEEEPEEEDADADF